MLVSLAKSGDTGLGFSTDQRRANVMLSRASNLLVIFGDWDNCVRDQDASTKLLLPSMALWASQRGVLYEVSKDSTIAQYFPTIRLPLAKSVDSTIKVVTTPVKLVTISSSTVDSDITTGDPSHILSCDDNTMVQLLKLIIKQHKDGRVNIQKLARVVSPGSVLDEGMSMRAYLCKLPGFVISIKGMKWYLSLPSSESSEGLVVADAATGHDAPLCGNSSNNIGQANSEVIEELLVAILTRVPDHKIVLQDFTRLFHRKNRLFCSSSSLKKYIRSRQFKRLRVYQGLDHYMVSLVTPSLLQESTSVVLPSDAPSEAWLEDESCSRIIPISPSLSPQYISSCRSSLFPGTTGHRPHNSTSASVRNTSALPAFCSLTRLSVAGFPRLSQTGIRMSRVEWALTRSHTVQSLVPVRGLLRVLRRLW